MKSADLEAELRSRLKLRVFPEFAGLRLWLAHSGSGLAALCDAHGADAPYWGYPWPGGLALADYLLAHPDVVRRRRVLDFGAGCGLAGIVAHLVGATSVRFHDIDPLAQVAARLNAGENGLEPAEWPLEVLGPGDVVLAGDVFYDAAAAAESLKVLRSLQGQGASVLIGDPFRHDLPIGALVEIGRIAAGEVGVPKTAPESMAGIFQLAG